MLPENKKEIKKGNMKGEKRIIGKKIVSIVNCHDYSIVTLEDGIKLEIGSIDLPEKKQKTIKKGK